MFLFIVHVIWHESRVILTITAFQDLPRMLRKERFRFIVHLGVDDRTPGLDIGRVLDEKVSWQPTQAFHQRAGWPPIAAEFVGDEIHDRQFRFRRANGADGVAAHGDGLAELAATQRTQHVQAHAYGAGTVAVDDDVPGRAVEVPDVLLYPIKGGDLIEHAVITGRFSVGRREESQDV